jgi:hypothetical protein
MKIDLIQPKPVPPPPDEIVLRLSHSEFRDLLIAADALVRDGDRPLSDRSSPSGLTTTNRRGVLANLKAFAEQHSLLPAKLR